MSRAREEKEERAMASRSTARWSRRLFVTAIVVQALGGCATPGRSLEKVAKDWCQTIRASQIMCTYPLTEDLRPGDVFLVQTPLAEEQKLYRERGFLPLSDHRKRLLPAGKDYKEFYADAYWKDEFGAGIPNARPKRPDPGALDENKPALTEVNAPRAVFPSYTFQVENRSGLALAVPVNGVPLGLNYLQADSATGSLLIGDARSYGLDSMQLYAMLREWLEDNPEARQIIHGTVRQSQADHVLLRVVTRAYMTGGMIVSLTRAGTRGAEVAAGNAPALSLVDANGNINQNVSTTLTALEGKINTQALATGGRVKFLSASNSAVTLAESFDRMLVVGYLAVDVPFFRSGCLGYPLPTYERLENLALAQPALPAGVLSPLQQQFKANAAALAALAKDKPEAAGGVMQDVMKALKAKEFEGAEAALKQYRADPTSESALGKAMQAFKLAATQYVTLGGDCGDRYERFAAAFIAAFDQAN
jgi:hypothetical protein